MRDKLLDWLSSEPASSPFSILWDWLPRHRWRAAQLFWIGIIFGATAAIIKQTHHGTYLVMSVGDYWVAPLAVVEWMTAIVCYIAIALGVITTVLIGF